MGGGTHARARFLGQCYRQQGRCYSFSNCHQGPLIFAKLKNSSTKLPQDKNGDQPFFSNTLPVQCIAGPGQVISVTTLQRIIIQHGEEIIKHDYHIINKY